MPRPFCVAVLALGAGATTGCQRAYQVERAATPTHQVHFDEALALRDWQRSTAFYANGDVWAGPTNSYYDWPVGDPADDNYMQRQRLAIVAEPLIALGQLVALPVTLLIDPPIEKRRYAGTEVGPTYTAAVPPQELQRETRQGRQNLQRAQRQQRQSPPTTRPTEG